jgi:hypothetical protein
MRSNAVSQQYIFMWSIDLMISEISLTRRGSDSEERNSRAHPHPSFPGRVWTCVFYFIWNSMFDFEDQSRISSVSKTNKQTDERFEVEKKKIDLLFICNRLVTLTSVILGHRRVECFARLDRMHQGLVESRASPLEDNDRNFNVVFSSTDKEIRQDISVNVCHLAMVERCGW